jgi:hypothetical protein
VSLLGGPTSRSPATAAHLSHTGPRPHIKVGGRPRPLPTPSVAPHDLSSVSTPGRNGGRSGCTKYASSDKGSHAPLTPLGLRGQLSSQLGQAPSLLHHARIRQHRQAVTTSTASLNGHILLGSHEFAHISGLTPTSNFCPRQTFCPGSLNLHPATSGRPCYITFIARTHSFRSHKLSGTSNNPSQTDVNK